MGGRGSLPDSAENRLPHYLRLLLTLTSAPYERGKASAKIMLTATRAQTGIEPRRELVYRQVMCVIRNSGKLGTYTLRELYTYGYICLVASLSIRTSFPHCTCTI